MFYHARATFAVTKRVLQQLSHDPRTIAMIFVVPVALLSLLWWLFVDYKQIFNSLAPALMAIFPLIIMFLITSIATLRERTGGTLERVLAMPIGKLDFVLGYAFAFGLLAVVQALLTSFVALNWLDLSIAGPTWFLVVVGLLDALLGMSLGLLVSAFARNEFQAVQFMPVVIIPQLLVCGLLLPVDKMPDVLQVIAHSLPMTYAVEALQNVTKETTLSANSWRDLVVIASSVVVAVLLGALTLRRSSK